MEHREIELKFGVIGELQDVQQRLNGVGTVTDARRDELQNVYFDTPEQQLFAAGVGLRVRTGSCGCEQTLKLRGENFGGVHNRGEYNAELPAGTKTPDVSRVPPEAWPAGLDLARLVPRLKPICTVNFTRESWNVETMGCVFEVAYDRGIIRAADHAGEAVINELEVELKSTERPEDELLLIFCGLITALADQNLPLTAEPFSKMHRAMILTRHDRAGVYLAARSPSDDLSAYIIKLVKSYESFYGLLCVSPDPQLWACLRATLHTLIRALRQLRRSGVPAFLQDEREPYRYRHDLKVILRVLKLFATWLRAHERAFTDAALSADAAAVARLLDKMRRRESRLQLYVIPMKLKALLTMLVR